MFQDSFTNSPSRTATSFQHVQSYSIKVTVVRELCRGKSASTAAAPGAASCFMLQCYKYSSTAALTSTLAASEVICFLGLRGAWASTLPHALIQSMCTCCSPLGHTLQQALAGSGTSRPLRQLLVSVRSQAAPSSNYVPSRDIGVCPLCSFFPCSPKTNRYNEAPPRQTDAEARPAVHRQCEGTGHYFLSLAGRHKALHRHNDPNLSLPQCKPGLHQGTLLFTAGAECSLVAGAAGPTPPFETFLRLMTSSGCQKPRHVEGQHDSSEQECRDLNTWNLKARADGALGASPPHSQAAPNSHIARAM